MKIVKIINNNVVYARDKNNEHVIVMGKGIGFSGRHGDVVDPEKIEKVIRMDSQNSMDRLISPLCTAAALQLETVIPNFTIHEHHVYNRHPYNKQLCIYDYQPVNGYFTVPELPGLGNELSDYCFTHGQRVTIE